MKGVVRRRESARRDLVAAYRRYHAEAGQRVADRFLAAAEKTFKLLADLPGTGTRYRHDHPALAELRYFPLSSRFKVYIVFYVPAPDGITVVRVLHGARDLDAILAQEYGLEDEGL